MNTPVMLRGIVVVAGCLLGGLAATKAGAQDWPARPVTMVIPLAAGSGLDVMGRVLSGRLSELLGQPVIIENVGGAGGMTGAVRVAKALPNGYQFLLGTVGTHAQNQALYKNPSYNAATDFSPVALIAEAPIVLIARKDLPVNNLQEFISYTKANQTKMQYGSAGTGSAAHLGCALLNAAIGVSVTHVPYRGGAGAMQDLIAGRIDYACPVISIAKPQIEGGSIKALAILTKDRSPIMPELASAHEQGIINFEAGIWYAIFLPKGTPRPIVQKLHDAIVATLNTSAVQDRLKVIGTTVVAPERRSPAYLQSFVESEIGKWTAIIRDAGVTAE